MATGKINLLVVDDDELLCETLSEICAHRGHGVRTAMDGFSALGEIRHRRPQLLISDLHMPGMSGYELLSVVRRRFPAMRVIAMSSMQGDDGVPAGIAADHYYEKNGSFTVLLEMIDTIAKTSARRERESRRYGNRHATLQAPLWVARNGHNPSGESYVTLTCPECLRTFPQALDGSSRQIHRTGCVHCHNEVDFAIVQPQHPVDLQARATSARGLAQA
jgi:CheY-like chemotaxis protein